MDKLTMFELHLDGITFPTPTETVDDEPVAGASEAERGDDVEAELPAPGMRLGRRIGRALAMIVVVAVVGRALVGRVRRTETDADVSAPEEPEVVSVDASAADEN